MINALVIVWRESFEAVLIVGIIYSFLKRQSMLSRSIHYMWWGILAGLALSALLAFGIHAAQSEIQGQAIEYFNVATLLVAALLMAHMSVWMKFHAKNIKGELEKGLGKSLSQSKLYGVAGLTALAIAREGFELVTFFYGMGVEAIASQRLLELTLYAAGGLGLTALTAYSLNVGLKFFDRRLFFTVTTIFLLVTAASLVAQASRRLVQMEAIPTMIDQVWDTSMIIDERSPVGQWFAMLTGYESTPALVTALAYGLFWVLTAWFYRRESKTLLT